MLNAFESLEDGRSGNDLNRVGLRLGMIHGGKSGLAGSLH